MLSPSAHRRHAGAEQRAHQAARRGSNRPAAARRLHVHRRHHHHRGQRAGRGNARIPIEFGFSLTPPPPTPMSLQVLLPASSLLQIQSVREACCKFLMRQLHPSNCLGIRSFAGKCAFTQHYTDDPSNRLHPLQTPTRARSCTRARTSTHCRTFSKWSAPRSFCCCRSVRYECIYAYCIY